MDIETNNNTAASSKINKELLRFEKPIYEIKKSEESESEFIIRKLMNRKVEKPTIGFI
jgi:hypothetical protein